MSDRASNEKLADKLLNKWRDEMLKSCENDIDKQSVKNFHCMAYVLLGFHRYICNDIKVLEKSLVDQYGPLGRDSLPIFKFWSKAGTIIERVVRTTSDTFGPAGDHLGLRDRWEAYCTEKGILFIYFGWRHFFILNYNPQSTVTILCLKFLNVPKSWSFSAFFNLFSF
ncbi:hypothetical protein ACJMK2_039329 [Sinanodonta woodiana]|uniref:Uncharacterized protein n=1 Tax=Sinanodonta woodiana TaxID=1069815 RepID=A0ABD3WBQ1_SINWO